MDWRYLAVSTDYEGSTCTAPLTSMPEGRSDGFGPVSAASEMVKDISVTWSVTLLIHTPRSSSGTSLRGHQGNSTALKSSVKAEPEALHYYSK